MAKPIDPLNTMLHHPNRSGMMLLSLLPGIALMAYFADKLILATYLAAAIGGAIAADMIGLIARHHYSPLDLKDGKAVLVGVLLALLLPPTLSWWMVSLGAAFGVLIGLHFYGRFSHLPFNGAAIGYVFLLAFAPSDFGFWMISHRAESTQTILLVNAAFTIGGLFLIFKKTVHWQTPVGLLGFLLLFHLIYNITQTTTLPLSSTLGMATALSAFYVANDPRSDPDANAYRFMMGVFCGAAYCLLTQISSHPNALIAAVLITNFIMPAFEFFVDQFVSDPPAHEVPSDD